MPLRHRVSRGRPLNLSARGKPFFARCTRLVCQEPPARGSEESAAYVHSRMASAGLRSQAILSPHLLDEIHFRSQGIPRLINAICDNLLLTAFAMESKVANLEMLDEVTQDMRLDYPGKTTFRPENSYPEQILRRPEIRFRTE